LIERRTRRSCLSAVSQRTFLLSLLLIIACGDGFSESRRLDAFVAQAKTASDAVEWEQAVQKFAARARSPLVRAEAAYLYGNVLREQSRWKEAASAYERADVAAFPLRDFARFYRTQCVSRSGEFDRAVQLYESLLSEFPAFPLRTRATFGLAENLVALERYAESAPLYQSLADDEDFGRPARIGLAAAYNAIGRARDAVDLLQAVIEEKNNDTHALKAYELLQKVVSKNPALKLTRQQQLAHGYVLLGAGRRSAAREMWDKVASGETDALATRARYEIAMSYMRERDWTNAKAVLAKIVKTGDPEYRAKADLQIILANRRAGNRATALRMFGEYSAKYPKASVLPEALTEYGWTLRDSNDYSGARGVYERIVSDFPDANETPEAAWQVAWCDIKLRRYEDAIASLERLVGKYPKTDAAARGWFWLGKIHERLSNWDEAAKAYRRVVEDDVYYYVNRAYERLDALTHEGKIPSSFVPAIREYVVKSSIPTTELEKFPSERVRILRQLNDVESVVAELTHLSKSSPENRPHYTYQLVRVYQENGQAYPAYLAASRFVNLPDVRGNGMAPPEEIGRLLYPLPYPDIIERAGREFEMDPEYIAAMIREESRFNPKAKSAAGAYGLMQVMPDTGASIARALDVDGFNKEMLYEPDINIRFGTYYMRSLMRDLQNDLYLLAGAYNGGPGRMSRWLSEFVVEDRDEFVEQIPIDETRNHIKKVMHAFHIYQRLYAGYDATLERSGGKRSDS
jgi:soluble lytic murein transglycosylase